jgi:phage baseplate assembly protein W
MAEELPLSLQDRFTARRSLSDNVYSDFLVNLDFHPETNLLMVNRDIKAINRSIKNLIFTNKYERLFNPGLGSNINSILFQLHLPSTANDLKNLVENMINNYEPRVSLLEVQVQPFPNQNGYVVKIAYAIKSISDPIVLNLSVIREQ